MPGLPAIVQERIFPLMSVLQPAKERCPVCDEPCERSTRNGRRISIDDPGVVVCTSSDDDTIYIHSVEHRGGVEDTVRPTITEA